TPCAPPTRARGARAGAPSPARRTPRPSTRASLHGVLGIADLRIRAEQQLGGRPPASCCDARRSCRHRPFEDLGGARQDVDVIALDGQEAEATGDDQLRALAYLRHLEARLVGLLLEERTDAALDRGVTDELSLEAAGDAFHRHVVVGSDRRPPR